jgi:hypothetical protein
MVGDSLGVINSAQEELWRDLVNGGAAGHLRKETYTTLKPLQEREAAAWRIDERFDHYQNAQTSRRTSLRTVC